MNDGTNMAILELQVQMALHQLDHDTRREYESALQTAPELVRNESRFVDFLYVERNNPPKAAIRIAKYWKARKKVFGDRWLLPMNQTGHGALSKEDIDVLRSGYIVIMPRPSGGIIALFDESKLQREAEEAKIRIIFYFSSIFRRFAMHGKTIVHVVTSAQRPNIDLQAEEWRIRESAMPGSGLVKPNIFVAQAYEEGKQELVDFMGYRTLRAEQFKTQMPIERIAGNSVRTTVTLLEERGLERNLIPRCLGGNFDYSEFNDWIRQRLSIEGVMSAAPLRITTVRANTPGAIKPGSRLVATQRTRSPALPLPVRPQLNPPGDNGERQISDVDSQSPKPRTIRTYKKRNQQAIALTDQGKRLRHQNGQLRESNRRLESYLAQARLLVAVASQQPTEK